MGEQPTTLADQLVALCKQHGLNALSVEVHVSPDGGSFFGSYAHAEGICGSASCIRDTPHGVIGEAITNLKAKLGENLIDVPELAASDA